MRAAVLLGLLAAACGSRSSEPPPPDPPAGEPAVDLRDLLTSPPRSDASVECVRQERFAATIPLPEASGAVHVPEASDAPAHLLVISDSGNRGAYVELDPDTGEVLARGALPLDDGASDDLEGLALAGGVYYAITSSGWMRHYRREADGYRLEVEAYPLAAPGGDPPLVCATGTRINCARNYEGLCLGGGDGACAGFALSKTDGALHCLVRDGERLRIDPGPRLEVALGEVLSGCSFAPDGSLWVGANLFGARAVYRITNHADPGSARVEEIGSLGPGSPEALATGPDGALWRFSDTNSSPSLVERYNCR
jgi:hypothetical protein